MRSQARTGLLEQLEKFIFRDSCFSYDFHEQPFSNGIVSRNRDAFSLLISEDYVTAGLSHGHKTNFSEGLENFSPRYAWKSR